MYDWSFRQFFRSSRYSCEFINYFSLLPLFHLNFPFFCILVKLENYEAAASSFEAALETAKLQGDEDAEVAICKALDDVKTK